jgi:hypothetical protein
MSHIPLLHREYRDIPRLQPPRRGPQVCISVVILVTIGVVVSGVGISGWGLLSVSVAHNATLPLPPEARRTRTLAAAMAGGVQLHASELAGPTLHDLIVAVGYLLDKQIESR